MKVQDVMAKNPRSAAPNDSIQFAANEMRLHEVGMLPVLDGGRLVGVITDRDIVVECVATDSQPSQCRVEQHMTANPIIIGPDADISEALELMGQQQIRRLCVVEDGRLRGIVALGDLAVQPLPADAVAAALSHVSRRNWHLGQQRVHV